MARLRALNFVILNYNLDNLDNLDKLFDNFALDWKLNFSLANFRSSPYQAANLSLDFSNFNVRQIWSFKRSQVSFIDLSEVIGGRRTEFGAPIGPCHTGGRRQTGPLPCGMLAGWLMFSKSCLSFFQANSFAVTRARRVYSGQLRTFWESFLSSNHQALKLWGSRKNKS